ncbi:MAG: type II toxin-antitoxin system YafQ family toxin [Planctomycetota bacterium]|jgi:mRNA interferase YafQ|nr:type II toxin-antitoxin system YafQ family toxin [Planctomycetota bacterium]
MLNLVNSSRYKKDRQRMLSRGKDDNKLDAVLLALIAQQSLPPRHCDHRLTGDYEPYRECHIEPDWLLIYRVVGDTLELYRTGSHSDLF